MNLPFGVPFTVDQAYPFIKNSTVIFGFPDILFESNGSFSRLLKKQEETQADVVLGLFPTNHPNKADMVNSDKTGRIRKIEVKPDSTDLRYAWIIAIWTSKFTQFMHNLLCDITEKLSIKQNFKDVNYGNELYLGDVFQAAIDHDILLQSVIFHNKRYFDIGTPNDLIKALKRNIF
jgi:glucose-1-phosphate thymidylyltransferase